MLKILTILILLSFQIYSGEQEIKAYMKQQNSKLDNETADRIYKNVIYYSKQHNVDPVLVFSVMKTESHFRHSTVSTAGAKGLMQLMPSTAQGLGVTNAYDAEQNIMGGTKYLKGLMDRFDNNKSLALAAYNAGPNAVKKYGGIPPYMETQNYVKNVLGSYERMKGDK